MINFVQGVVSAVAGDKAGIAVNYYLGKHLYPINNKRPEDWDMKWFHRNKFTFFTSGITQREFCRFKECMQYSIRGYSIDLEKYDQLSVIQKISAAVIMIFAGGFVSAVVASASIGFIAIALNPTTPFALSLSSSVIISSLLSAISAGLHDPTIGFSPISDSLNRYILEPVFGKNY